MMCLQVVLILARRKPTVTAQNLVGVRNTLVNTIEQIDALTKEGGCTQ